MATAAERLMEFLPGCDVGEIAQPVITKAKQDILGILGISLARPQVGAIVQMVERLGEQQCLVDLTALCMR
jgi:hypothetical protein